MIYDDPEAVPIPFARVYADPELAQASIVSDPDSIGAPADPLGIPQISDREKDILKAASRNKDIVNAAAGDIDDIVTGTSGLISGALMLPYRAVQAVKETRAGKPFNETTLGQQADLVKSVVMSTPGAIKDRAVELATHPIKAFEEHPINTALDLSLLYAGAGAGARGAARLGSAGLARAGEGTLARALERAALSTEGQVVPAGSAIINTTYSKNPLTKATQVAIEKASGKSPVLRDVLGTPGIRGLVPPAALGEADRMAIVTEEEISRAKLRRFAQTKDRVGNVINNIETLSGADEPGQIGSKASFAAVAEGRASALDKKLYDAVEWWKTQATTDAKDLDLTPQKQRMVAYQPLVVAAKGTQEGEIGSFSIKPDLFESSNKATRMKYLYPEAEAGNVTAIREVYRRASYGDKTAAQRVEKWTADTEKFRVNSIKSAVSDFMSGDDSIRFVDTPSVEGALGKTKLRKGPLELGGQLIDRPGKSPRLDILTKDLLDATSPDPVYFPHKFLQRVKMSEWGAPTKLQKERPSFLKGRSGAEGYETTDPGKVLALHAHQVEKFRMQQDLVNVVKNNFAKPLKKSVDLLPGYVPFAPDGYLSFYKTALGFGKSFTENLAKKLGVEESALDAAAKELFPSAAREHLVVGKPTIYQIPIEVMRKVTQELQPLSLFGPEFVTPVKLLYDIPLEAFKYTVLGLRPAWVVNNFAGNIITSLLGGVNLPSALLKAGKKSWLEAAAPALREVEEGGFRKSEQRFMGRVRFNPNQNKIEAWLDTTRQLATGDAIFENPTLEFLRKSLTGTPTKGKLTLENFPSKAISMVTAPFRLPKKIAEGMYDWNARVEDSFRRAAYLDFADKAARIEVAKQFGGSLMSSWKTSIDSFMNRGVFSEENLLKKIKELSTNVRSREDIITQVDDVLNNYSRLSNVERQIIRRVFPFWAWWKFMNVFGITLVAKHPAMAQMVRGLSIVGNDLEKNEWASVGLDPNEVPIWKRGSAVRNYGGKRDKMVKLLSGRAMNPLTSFGPSELALSPSGQMGLERIFGRKLETGGTFTDPNVTEIGPGRFLKYNPETKKAELMMNPPRPPIIADYLRRHVPVIRDLELSAYPFRTYDTSGLFDPTPMVSRTGKPISMDPSLRLASIFGMPLSELERRTVLYNRPKVRQAAPKMRVQLRRLGKILGLQEGE
jgi:hypothetical protein